MRKKTCRILYTLQCEINFAGVRNIEVRPAISTNPNPIPNHKPNCKLSLLINGKKSKTR